MRKHFGRRQRQRGEALRIALRQFEPILPPQPFFIKRRRRLPYKDTLKALLYKDTLKALLYKDTLKAEQTSKRLSKYIKTIYRSLYKTITRNTIMQLSLRSKHNG